MGLTVSFVIFVFNFSDFPRPLRTTIFSITMPGKKSQAKTRRPKKGGQRKGPAPAKAQDQRAMNVMVPKHPNPKLSSQLGLYRKNRRLAEAVCSQSDPFCVAAKGAKMFDRSMTPSVTFQVVQTGVLPTVGVTGNALLQVTAADCYQGYRTAATFSGSAVASWNARVVPSGSAWLTANVNKFRVVSFGVRYYATVSPMSASGVITIGTAQETLSAPDPDNADWTEVARTPVSAAEGAWVGKPRDDDYSTYSVTSLASTTIPQYYTQLNLGVGGGPLGGPTTILGFEIIWNLECVLNTGNASMHLATPAAPHIPQIEAAASRVTAITPSHNPGPLAALGDMVMKHADRQIGTIMEKGAESLLAMLF